MLVVKGMNLDRNFILTWLVTLEENRNQSDQTAKNMLCAGAEKQLYRRSQLGSKENKIDATKEILESF